MSSDRSEADKQTRRRGAELEAAILDAAWTQLTEAGYEHLSIDAVAGRAGTSKPVLYRRWKNSEELLHAAIRRRGSLVREAAVVPDTGSLREDMLILLREANSGDNGLVALMSGFVGSHFNEHGWTPADLRRDFIGDGPSRVDAVMAQAVARGEVDPARLTARKVALAFDLFRHEYLMTLTPVPEAVLVEIVDEIFLPLVLSGRQPDG
jgi:AcrR family transcriptional regulator